MKNKIIITVIIHIIVTGSLFGGSLYHLKEFEKTGIALNYDLSGFDMRKSIKKVQKNNLPIIFEGSNLSNTNFEHCNLNDADFGNTDCFQANFAHCSLKGVNFLLSIVTEANFFNADIENAYFIRTNCNNANFDNVKNKENADFTEAIW